MTRHPLTWPFAGRMDESALADQPEFTTRAARNVRNRDPMTGRITGASRSGMVKWNPDQIAPGRIKALCSTAIDTRKTEFSFSEGEIVKEWDQPTPSKMDSLGGVVDRRGNVYALDGTAGIVKFNSAGYQVVKIALPVADPAHVVRALWVDERDRIFAGVSAGGDPATARVWCVLQLEDSEYAVLWTLEPGGYTEELQVVRGSQLYCAHNYPSQNRARVIVYENLPLEPAEASRIETVAYPIHGMWVEDGNVYCASGESHGDIHTGSISAFEEFRKGHPAARGFHPPVVAWTPLQLTDARKRIWSWYDAEDIDETDVEQTGTEAVLEEGQQILRWRDKSGNERHWYAGNLSITGESGPTYSKVGPGGLAAVRFTNDATHKQSLVTFGNASTQPSLADQQRTAIPGYTGAMWCMFILVRITPDDDPGSSGPRLIFNAQNDASGASNHSLWINRACGATEPGTYASKQVSYFADTDATDAGGCSGSDQADSEQYSDRQTNCVLVTVLWDGGVDAGSGGSATRCTVRLNGKPVDRFTGLAFETLQAPTLAYAPSVATAAARRLNGEVCELLVLGRADRFDDSTEPKVVEHDLIDFVFAFPAGEDQTDNEMTRIESYMLHKRGLGHLLGGSIGVFQGRWPHPYGQLENPTTSNALHGPTSPPDYATGGRSAAFEQLTQRYPMVTKHDSLGRLQWVCNEETHPDTGADRGGIGWAVRARKVESDGLTHVWMAGPDAVQATTGDVAVRKVIDLGEDFSGDVAEGAWRHAFSGGGDLGYEYPRMASDKFGNLYFPGYQGSGGTIRVLHILEKDPDVGGDAVQLAEFLLASPANVAYGLALPPDALTPGYRGDVATEMAERVYLFTPSGDGVIEPSDSVFAIRLVQVDAVANGNPREVVTLAVTEDDLRIVTASGNTVATGGSAVVDGASQFVQAIRAGEHIVVLDGTRLLAYDLREGTAAVLTAKSAGEVPSRPRYAAYWRHRLMLALDGGKYAASRLGNIFDWNLNPGSNIAGIPLQTSTQAFTGTITRAGEAEDSLVTIIPAWDDLCFLVGESRILRLTGDPQAGGSIHLVTDSMGGVFGDSWCKDDRGRVFMWGNRPPGLYQLQPEGDPIPLSDRTLEATEFLSEIDYATHRIVLSWDPIERGVRIFQVAWGSSAVVAHWFWEEKSHRLVQVPATWQDRIAASGKQPTAVTFLGGDDTKALLVGCDDGYIRMFDPSARDDDGTAIDSYVVFELTRGMEEKQAARLNEISVVLASDQEGARLEVFAGETADRLGPILAARDLKPGRNEPFRVRAKGAHLWARIRNAKTGRWRFEEGSVDLVGAGKARQKAT